MTEEVPDSVDLVARVPVTEGRKDNLYMRSRLGSASYEGADIEICVLTNGGCTSRSTRAARPPRSTSWT